MWEYRHSCQISEFLKKSKIWIFIKEFPNKIVGNQHKIFFRTFWMANQSCQLRQIRPCRHHFETSGLYPPLKFISYLGLGTLDSPTIAYFSNPHSCSWVTSQFSVNKMVDKRAFCKGKSGHKKLLSRIATKQGKLLTFSNLINLGYIQI